MTRFLIPLFFLPLAASAEPIPIEADLLIVGGDEAGCAAAVQAARLGVGRIVLVNDIDWLGGQFSVQGIGPVDEWTIVDGKRVDFPASGAFQEILERIRAHNRRTYGTAWPGNGWCGRHTIEPRAAAAIFDDWLAAQGERIRIIRNAELAAVQVEEKRVTGAVFRGADGAEVTVRAELTIDATDWGDVIRMSGAGYLAGPDLRSRFGEAGAPETLEPGGHQEMNPLSWCPLLRETEKEGVIPKPARYDERSFANWKSARVWVEWDGSGGIYNFAGWSIYTHRRLVDRHHFGFAPGTETLVLNWPAHGYPLSTLPRHVAEALEADEPGASDKNIVDMTPAQRGIIHADAKQRSLEFLHFLQTAAEDRRQPGRTSFRQFRLAEDYGTEDNLPPKPYIREGLRLEALYMLREQDVRTPEETPLWARSMVPDGVFGYQFNMDFHPTRRVYVENDPGKPWYGRHHGTRDWSAHTDRAMFPLRGLVPVETDGLLGCSKNIGVTSLVQSSLRLHGQMMHVGTAAGTVAAIALRDGVPPRDVAMSLPRVREVQSFLVRGTEGPGTLLWPWHDVRPEDRYFEAANLLPVLGIWRADRDSVFFRPDRVVSRGELAGALVRLRRAVSDPPEWPVEDGEVTYRDVPVNHPDRPWIRALLAWGNVGTEEATFRPEGPATWSLLHRWLGALGLPVFPDLVEPRHAASPLTRAEAVEFLHRALRQRGELHPAGGRWLLPGEDQDGDGQPDLDDPLPQDRDNNSVPDHLEPRS